MGSWYVHILDACMDTLFFSCLHCITYPNAPLHLCGPNYSGWLSSQLRSSALSSGQENDWAAQAFPLWPNKPRPPRPPRPPACPALHLDWNANRTPSLQAPLGGWMNRSATQQLWIYVKVECLFHVFVSEKDPCYVAASWLALGQLISKCSLLCNLSVSTRCKSKNNPKQPSVETGQGYVNVVLRILYLPCARLCTHKQVTL